MLHFAWQSGEETWFLGFRSLLSIIHYQLSIINYQLLIMKNNLDPEQYKRLKAELKTPYKGLRKFIYGAFGASGFIGAVIFFAQVIAGRNLNTALPNLALQVGVVALMIFLFRLEDK